MRRFAIALGMVLAFSAGTMAPAMRSVTAQYSVDSLPTLPPVIQGLAGPITVAMRDTLRNAGRVGHWDAQLRLIEVERGSPVFERQIVFHELIHAALWDAGHQLGGATEERLADIIGAAMSTSGCVFR